MPLTVRMYESIKHKQSKTCIELLHYNEVIYKSKIYLIRIEGRWGKTTMTFYQTIRNSQVEKFYFRKTSELKIWDSKVI